MGVVSIGTALRQAGQGFTLEVVRLWRWFGRRELDLTLGQRSGFEPRSLRILGDPLCRERGRLRPKVLKRVGDHPVGGRVAFAVRPEIPFDPRDQRTAGDIAAPDERNAEPWSLEAPRLRVE
jgi:hypothetical protein